MKSNLESIKVGLLAIISVCIIILVIQGFSKTGTQDVYVRGGHVDAYVSGHVDANLSEINGHRNVFFNNPRRGDKDKYYVIPVTCE